MKKAVLFFCLILLFPALASADESKFSKEFYLCLEAAQGMNGANLNCIYDETEKQDVRLNQVYNRLITVLSEQRIDELREVQRAWIKYRDLTSQYLSRPDGGAIDLVISASWFLHRTSDQADFLEGQLNILSETP